MANDLELDTAVAVLSAEQAEGCVPHPADPTLVHFADGLLQPDEALACEAHLALCATCTELVLSFQTMNIGDDGTAHVGDFDAFTARAQTPVTPNKVVPFYRKYAVVTALAACLLAFVLLRQPPSITNVSPVNVWLTGPSRAPQTAIQLQPGQALHLLYEIAAEDLDPGKTVPDRLLFTVHGQDGLILEQTVSRAGNQLFQFEIIPDKPSERLKVDIYHERGEQLGRTHEFLYQIVQ